MRGSVLLIGDFMVDHYLHGRCERISPEAPVQVVERQREYDLLGGAGNVANNLVSLGARVVAAGVVGKDLAGDWIAKELERLGVEAHLFQEERPTTKKSRIIAGHQQIVRIDYEERTPISSRSKEAIMELVRRGGYDLILLSDYGKGVLTPDLVPQIIQEAKAPVIVDPKGEWEKYRGAFLLTPNRKEATLASGIEIVDDASLQEAGWKIVEELQLDHLLITLSEEGMALFTQGEMIKIPTQAREVYDVTGAGDTVLAALGYALAKGEGVIDGARFANMAAGVVVGKLGAATVTLAEIDEFMRRQAGLEQGVKKVEELVPILQEAKRAGKRVVFTNGCFDLLHLGHVRYLQEAKALGDILVVGLNSDGSVRRLKGEGRPIIPQEDRAQILAALEAVDYVVIFDEDTPYQLIQQIAPHILVKGGDYRGREVVGADLVEEVHLIDYLPGRSTTQIIERIVNGRAD
ncbi:MAG: bifunctional heptose 7-phosphate kinase/heptose 1-phosphate adenyltransferase [Nitratiruptor sp.]|nr:bifunctional heptose 7-phosphate kinase/heptose 1-phosphate adenyltransferase [Nitratiruptor sp.]NPA83794.1 D-glycero-beta-D-manno-heptose-7-phosphate kinase [Campylobacterota bacterium]